MIGDEPEDSHSNPEFPDEAYTLERRRKQRCARLSQMERVFFVCCKVKSVGEPDALVAHVRFCEGLVSLGFKAPSTRPMIFQGIFDKKRPRLHKI